MKRILSIALSMTISFLCIQSPLFMKKVFAEDNLVDNKYVQTVDFSKFNKDIEKDELMQTVEKVLLNANKYALGGWYTDRRQFDNISVNVGKYYNLYEATKLDKQIGAAYNTREYIYRSPASQAFGLAISLKTGAYDEEVVGVSKEEATNIAVKLATSVAHEHKANTGIGDQEQFKPWGGDWQAAHWAYYSGYAAWLLWDQLDEEQQLLVRNMVEYEANRFNDKDALYWKNRENVELYPGDTKQEEDSWNAELLNLASHMLPKHENAKIWYARMIEYQLAGFSTPEMNYSNEILHGVRAKDWVFGYNVNSNGTLVNHNRVHPAYNASATGVNSSIVDSLLNEKLPEAAIYNLDIVYKGLTEAKFDCPPYDNPGGTMYREDGSIYYPQGSDWGQGLYDVYANIDISAYVYGYAEEDVAKKWAKIHANKVLEQQNRFKDGHTYNPGEFTYALNEEAISTRMGSAYMTLWLKEQVGVEFSNEPLEYYPDSIIPDPIEENQMIVDASESTMVRGGSYGDINYSSSDLIEIRKNSNDAKYNLEGFIKFNLDDAEKIPEAAIIKLKVAYKGVDDINQKVIHKAELIESESWDEKTLTYNNKPQGTGKVIAEWNVSQVGETCEIDVTKYVQEAIQEGKELSIRIYTEENSSDNNIKYSSRLSRQGPKLLLTFKEDVDKTELTNLYNENKDLKQGNYTDESWEEFQAALENAKIVIDKADATEKDVNDALQILKDAIQALVEKPVEPSIDKTELDKLYNEYKDMEQGNYTDKSWEEFQVALGNAKGVLDNKEATQEEIDSAIKNLNLALANLEEKGHSNNSDNNNVDNGNGDKLPSTGDVISSTIMLLLGAGSIVSLGVALKTRKREE